VVGTGSLNLAEYASVVDQKDFDLSIPLTIPGGSAVDPSLSLTVCSTISIHNFILTYFKLFISLIFTRMVFILLTQN
jgi:hypothetical protein